MVKVGEGFWAVMVLAEEDQQRRPMCWLVGPSHRSWPSAERVRGECRTTTCDIFRPAFAKNSSQTYYGWAGGSWGWWRGARGEHVIGQGYGGAEG